MKTKVFAMYLPQFHQIPENDKFWGVGFTDWIGVKNSKPLFPNHYAPKIPLNNNYYDLSKKEAISWQCDLANKYGIDGFAIYHYWFNNEKNLLTKPAEIILNNKDLNISFCFAWDNISWKRSWSKIKGNGWVQQSKNVTCNTDDGILVEYVLGKESDWENHYKYLLPFFKDPRYEKINNKPVFIIFHYSTEINKMVNYWEQLAKKDGFKGIYIIFRNPIFRKISKNIPSFYYEPISSGWSSIFSKIVSKLKKRQDKIKLYDYDKIWKKIIKKSKKLNSYSFSGCFVNYDDSPRRGEKGKCIAGGTPSKFGKYLKELYEISCNRDKEYIFLTAWNEWGEGAYLEPDSQNTFAYLEEVKKIKQQ